VAKSARNEVQSSRPATRSRMAKVQAGPSSPAQLDRVIHEPVRLGIVSALAVNRSMSFNELKSLLKTTDGNLSVHARKLEDSEYVFCEKQFEGRVPKTTYSLTSQGNRALENYLNHMEGLIRTARDA
jgi:DNA-binding transcriptional ArsR family regulator